MDTLATRTVFALIVCFSVTLFSACSGSDTVQGPEQPEGPVLSFEAIEGHWEGWGEEEVGNRFWIIADFESSAAKGKTAARIGYGNPSASRSNPPCRGTWKAEAVEGRTYTLIEDIFAGGCPDGTVVLKHDPEAGTLEYHFTAANGDPDRTSTGSLLYFDS